MQLEYTIKSIGIIKSGFTDPNDEGQHKLYETTGEAKIELFDEYKEGLLGLDKYYNAIFIIYWQHRLTNVKRSILTIRPSNDEKYPEIGVFCSASPPSPNPIAITACELLRIENNTLYVKGLDALDGSPVLDIKPYSPFNYLILGCRYPTWVNEHHKGRNRYKACLGDIYE